MIPTLHLTSLLAIQSDTNTISTPLQSLMHWANVQQTWELWLLLFGLLAQAVFFGRWVVQWFASERRGESHMPILFWWLSLAGASLLLVYYTLRGEPVGMLGQSVGWIIYLRNLHLLRRAANKSSQT